MRFFLPRLRSVLGAGALAVMATATHAQPIVIGQTAVLSGPLTGLSTEPIQGIQALIRKVNAEGGVHGRPLVLRQLDDANDPERASANVRQLAAEGAVALLMPIGTTSSTAALKAANLVKVPLVGAYTGAAPAVAPSPYGFPVRISFDREYGRIVEHLFLVGQADIAFAHNDNPGARSAMESTKKFIAERGKALLGSVAIAQDGADAASQAQALARLKPQAIVLSATNLVAAKFIKAYRDTGASAQFVSFSFLNAQQLHQDLGEGAGGVVVSQVVPYPWGVSQGITTEYQAALKAAGGQALSYGSLEGYVAAKIVVEGLRRAGAGASPESLKRALETFNPLDLGGLRVSYTPGEHRGLDYSELTMMRKDGRFVR